MQACRLAFFGEACNAASSWEYEVPDFLSLEGDVLVRFSS